MAKYILPFYEYQRGWYEIEADSLEEAKAIVTAEGFDDGYEQFYKDGYTEWDENELAEDTNG
jgi:hypothetical protein